MRKGLLTYIFFSHKKAAVGTQFWENIPKGFILLVYPVDIWQPSVFLQGTFERVGEPSHMFCTLGRINA